MHQPNVYPDPVTGMYRLLDDYAVTYGNIHIVVPMYFAGSASIPAWAWGLTYPPYHPVLIGPSIAHDWLFANHQVSLQMANQIFYGLLILNGAGKFKAQLMYRAVQMAGGFFWDLTPKKIKMLRALHIMIRKSPNFDTYHFPVDAIAA